MLTNDLLVTKTYRGKIQPVYVPFDSKHLEIAELIIEIFQRHVGKTYGMLAEEIDEIEKLEDVDYRLIRGLAQLLERRCVLEKDAVIDPVSARRVVFEECKGVVTDAEERKQVLSKAAVKLSVKLDELEKSLWADQEENLKIKEFQPLTPEKLLTQYNLSLTQTLLFKATGMEIRIWDHYQQVFRRIKQLGLMYFIESDKIYLDGAVSLFKLTERYGTALAKLLPEIMKCSKWWLKASIVRKTMQGKRIYDFTLDNTIKVFGSYHEATHIAEVHSCYNTDVVFDSAVEKEFYKLSFKDWCVKREPTILKAGQYAFIPDFSLERGSNKIYLEIVGFWTPEYLKKKIYKINQLKENIILLVNRNLACSSLDFKTDNVIFYDRKLPYLEIIKILRKYEEKQLSEEVKRLKNIEISLEGDIINLAEIAEQYGVGMEALKEAIERKKVGIDGYLLLGDQLVSSQALNVIKGELANVRKYNDAVRIFQRYGIKEHSRILEHLGYKVIWKGIDAESAEITNI